MEQKRTRPFPHSVLGIGNALVDLIYKLPSDQVLRDLRLPKGSMTLVDPQRARNIQEYLHSVSPTLSTGGSASNTISSIASLGGRCGFIGRTGKNDPHGLFYTSDLENHGIRAHFSQSEIQTGTAITLMSPDTERTFATCLGAAATLCAEDLDPAVFEGYDYFHVEGYLVQNYPLLETAISMAKRAGLAVSLDMASYNVVVEHRGFIGEMLERGVDIVFANEEEAEAYTGKKELEALLELSRQVPTAIVKLGPRGSIVMDKGRLHVISAESVEKIDSNGAGDSYAAGFLYGKSIGLSTQACGEIASTVATEVVKVVGPKLGPEKWAEILPKIREIEKKDLSCPKSEI